MKRKSNPARNWNVNTLVSRILIPLLVLAAYCASFAYLSETYLSVVGVSFVFSSILLQACIYLAAVAYLIVFVHSKVINKKGFSYQTKQEKATLSDLVLLLLPMTPVVQYVISNQDILSAADSVYVLTYFLIFCGITIYIIPLLLGVISSTWTLMLMGTAFSFMITSMAAISQQFSWYEEGEFPIQLLIFAGILLISWFLYQHNKKKILHLFILLIFMANNLPLLFSQDENTAVETMPLSEVGNSLLAMVGSRKPTSTPNIYLLVYDSYVSAETMSAYGINNQPQEHYLNSMGFELYPKTYSVGTATIDTMSRVLNASTEFYGEKRRAISGDGIVQKVLGDLNYETYGLFPSDYSFRGYDSSYSFSIPEKASPALVL
ncbi:hypothetical protein ACFLTX_01945, partial [Chloroflexota bacterium]